MTVVDPDAVGERCDPGAMSTLLLAEELFLLTHDDVSGKADSTLALDNGLAGAMLLDLAAADLIHVDDEAIRTSPIGTQTLHPLLAAAHEAIRTDDKPRKAKHWVNKLPSAMKPLRTQVGQSLAERGVLTEERRKVLGLFPTTKWPEADPAPERELRDRLGSVLVKGASPDLHTASLIALLSPLDLVPKVVDKPDRKDAGKRAKAIADQDLGDAATSKAVKDAVQAVQVAIMMGALIPATVVTTSS